MTFQDLHKEKEGIKIYKNNNTETIGGICKSSHNNEVIFFKKKFGVAFHWNFITYDKIK